MVNEDKLQVHEVRPEKEAPSLEVGPQLGHTRAVKLLQEAQTALSDHHPKQAATACMNLATALLKLGGAANKRRAAQEMLAAFAKLQGCSDALKLQSTVARQLLDLHDENPWLHDELANAIDACRSLLES